MAAQYIADQGEYLSRLLHQGEPGWSMLLAGMLMAFCFGAVHALSPGHGKTLVAAYLVGLNIKNNSNLKPTLIIFKKNFFLKFS